MYCIKCGTELPNDALFCSHCGTSLKEHAAKKQAAEQEAQRRAQEQEAQRRAEEQERQKQEAQRRAQEQEAQKREAQRRAAEQEAQRRAAEKQAAAKQQNVPKKKGGRLKGILTWIVMIFVIALIKVGVTEFTGNLFGPKKSDPYDKFFTSTMNGALYQDGVLTYGPVCMKMPGYQLVSSDGSEDCLVSSDNNNYFVVESTMEFNVSADATSQQDMLDSYKEKSDVSGSTVEMVDFVKSKVGKYPTIKYTISETPISGGDTVYLSEFIVFDGDQANKTARIQAVSYSKAAYEEMKRIYDSAYANETPLDYNATGHMSDNAISTGNSSDASITTDGSNGTSFDSVRYTYRTTSRYNLRTAPNGDVIRVLEEGTICYCDHDISGVSDWVEVELEDGTKGWIAGSGLTVAEP